MKEARGQLSSQSQSRKSLYKESVPEIADPPKKLGKVRNRFLSLPSIEGNVFAAFQNSNNIIEQL